MEAGRSSAEHSSSVEAVAAQSNAAYAVQSYSSAESFRGIAQCSSSVIDFSTRS